MEYDNRIILMYFQFSLKISSSYEMCFTRGFVFNNNLEFYFNG